MNFVFLKASEKCVKMSRTTLCDQEKIGFQKHDAIMNPELVLKLPKV